MLEGQVFHICEGNGQIVDSDPPFAIRWGVKQGGLDIEMGLVSPGSFDGVFSDEVVLLNFVDDDSVWVNRRTQNQIGSLCFDLDIAVRGYLAEAEGDSDSEDAFPSHFPDQTVVEFIGKFQAIHSGIEVLVVVKVAWGLLS